MIMWVAIVLILSLIVFVWVKMEHQFRLVKVAFLGFVVLLLILSMVVMFRSGEVDLSSPAGAVNAVYLYIGWLGEFGVELWGMGVDVTGRIINAVNVSESDFANGLG